MLVNSIIAGFLLASSGLAIPVSPVWQSVPVVGDKLPLDKLPLDKLPLDKGKDKQPSKDEGSKSPSYGGYRRQISVPVASGQQGGASGGGSNQPQGEGLVTSAITALSGDNNTNLNDLLAPQGNSGNGNGNLAGNLAGNDLVHDGLLNNSTNNIADNLAQNAGAGNNVLTGDNSVFGENNNNTLLNGNSALNDLSVSLLPLGGGGSLPLNTTG